MTYSIIARHPVTGEFGVACQSHFFGVGSAVNWAEAGAGAIVTQSFVNRDYGALGIERFRAGESAPAVLADLLAEDPHPELRQVAMVDHNGRFAVHTGARCVPVRGSRQGGSFSVQGNMLAGEDVLDAMAAAAETGLEAGQRLATVLVQALRAAERAGGDARGSQAAGIMVVGPHRTASPRQEVLVDLRVEDSTDPVGELERLVERHSLFEDIVSVLFAEGLMLGPFREPGPGATDAALDRLARAAAELGEENPEAALWRAVLLLRAGRNGEATDALARLYATRPDLRAFLARLREAGFLDAAAARGTAEQEVGLSAPDIDQSPRELP
ncbi:DUF1028 domain-containing protein [Pseudonocardia bannensis]|uniref:DUF1028 domain-containing protein n=1 Tax=Pseudonocardia bannensis TaxID=630973 RepID=A0A848DI91_9PSEU|nr:DUF1028 domain-containing protein [Pseudonocardia bannensis]NMH92221.1 DUF1028 domain-containing protein [Pseudonocardia bannensis]